MKNNETSKSWWNWKYAIIPILILVMLVGFRLAYSRGVIFMIGIGVGTIIGWYLGNLFRKFLGKK